MNILLINSNRYRTPPVPPLSLEHIAASIGESHHTCNVLDLCFSESPIPDIDTAMSRFSPDIVGITIRNIDTVIYLNNVFFLDEVKSFIDQIKKHDVPVILGGVGYSFIPENNLAYLGGDWGISGPGEQAIVSLLDTIDSGNAPEKGTVLNGWEYGFDPDLRVPRGEVIDYSPYIADRGLAGFETQKGCYGNCPYCMEARGAVMFRNPKRIVEELHDLASKGVTTFHLCDTAFNQDLDHCNAVLDEMIEHGPDISWALYLKSEPYSDELFRKLKQCGASMVTLSLPTGPNGLDHAAEQVRLARRHGLKMAVDLLMGFPGQTVESVTRTIERLREIQPETVGIMSTIRLYPHLPVTKQIISSKQHRENIFGETDGNPDFIRPVFYEWLSADMLRDIIGDDPLFKIEGFERTSNYERI